MKLKYLYDQLRSDGLEETVNEALGEDNSVNVSSYRESLNPLGLLNSLMFATYDLSSNIEGYRVEVSGDSSTFSIVRDRNLEDIERFLDSKGVDYNKERMLE